MGAEAEGNPPPQHAAGEPATTARAQPISPAQFVSSSPRSSARANVLEICYKEALLCLKYAISSKTFARSCFKMVQTSCGNPRTRSRFCMRAACNKFFGFTNL